MVMVYQDLRCIVKELRKKLSIQNQKLRLRKYQTQYLLLMQTIQLDLLQQIKLLRL